MDHDSIINEKNILIQQMINDLLKKKKLDSKLVKQ